MVNQSAHHRLVLGRFKKGQPVFMIYGKLARVSSIWHLAGAEL